LDEPLDFEKVAVENRAGFGGKNTSLFGQPWVYEFKIQSGKR